MADKRKLKKCLYPRCDVMFEDRQGSPPLCAKHDEMAEFMTWFADKMAEGRRRVAAQRPRLVVPGGPGFAG